MSKKKNSKEWHMYYRYYNYASKYRKKRYVLTFTFRPLFFYTAPYRVTCFLQPSSTSQHEKSAIIAVRGAGINSGAVYLTWNDYRVSFYRGGNGFPYKGNTYYFVAIG